MKPRKPTKEDGWIPFLEAFGSGQADGTIERQEARGQTSFVSSDTLPTDMQGRDTQEILTAAGIKFLGVVEDDPLFQYVELPPGWIKRATEHAMWSELLDDKGRIRAQMFYKAAFYDRHAHLSLSRRYTFRLDYDRREKANEIVAQVTDCDVVIFETLLRIAPKADDPREQHGINRPLCDQAEAEAEAWLVEHYPDWCNPAAYWD